VLYPRRHPGLPPAPEWITTKENLCLVGPAVPARPSWPSGWPSATARPGHRVLFATAAQWVACLAEAHYAGRLQAEVVRPGRYLLIVIDEVGYILFEPEAANLFF
jgi:hypothetical protein